MNPVVPIMPVAGAPDELIRVLNDRFRFLVGEVSAAAPASSMLHGFGAAFEAPAAGQTAYVAVPVGGTIKAWNIVLDAGTCTIKVWKIAVGSAIPTAANSINTSGVSISSGTAIHSLVLTDFKTRTVADEDIVGIHLEAMSGATQINFQVELE